MSWRNSGGSRGSSYRSRNDEGSVFQGGSAGGPPLPVLIGACIVLGVLGILLALAFGSRNTPQATAVQPTAIAPTAAATAAPAAATTAPAGGGAASGIPTQPQGPALASGSGEPLAIESQGDQPLFNADSLQATAGQVYTLTFRNTGQAVQHNWVLAESDTIDAVNTAAQQGLQASRDTLAAVPPADTPGLLVTTQMLKPGEEAAVSFTAPAAGTYAFFCTFPGHYLTMRGELVVN